MAAAGHCKKGGFEEAAEIAGQACLSFFAAKAHE